jgi:hypothetical protein
MTRSAVTALFQLFALVRTSSCLTLVVDMASTMSRGQGNFLSSISWLSFLRFWSGLLGGQMRRQRRWIMLTCVSPHRSPRAVVITRPRFESRRFLSLATRVSETLPLNDNEGSPITAPPSAHSPIQSLLRSGKGVCLFAARIRPGQRSGVNGEPVPR